MPNLNEISNGRNWRVYQKKQIASPFEFETEDQYIEMTVERFKKEWRLVAEISIDVDKKREYVGIPKTGAFLFMITNDNMYGTWTKKFPEELDDDTRSAWDLDLKVNDARNTSVGDIYHDLDSNLFFMIMGVGFKQIRMRSEVDADSARPQTKRYEEFPEGFADANKMWKSILKKYYPDLIGLPVYGMTNRGSYQSLAHAIFKHEGSGKYEIVKDLENWASSMQPMTNPNSMSSEQLRQAEILLKENPHKFDSYNGTQVYVNLFQGGDEDARYD
jgi:hypothetical protein